MSWFEDYEDMRMECDECHTVINFHEEDIHDGTYIVCPRCGKHIELEGWESPKMVDIDKVKDWIFDTFYEDEHDGDYDYGQPYIVCTLDTMEQLLKNFEKTMEE